MYDNRERTDSIEKVIQTDFHGGTDNPRDMGWEEAREHIRPCLTPRGWERQIMGETVELAHNNYLDLSVYYHIRLTSMDENRAKMAWIDHTTAKDWGITMETLERQALWNMRRDGYSIQSINRVLTALLDDNTLSRNINDGSLYVLTNEKGLFGAAGILDKTMIATFARSIDNDLYIIPSSIHEILLCPDNGSVAPEELDQIVRDVNAVQVAPHERLADHVYHYNRELDEIQTRKQG